MNTKLDFRKLKEQHKRKRVDHPLSNLPLKNELLWESHLLSRKHKEAVATLKAEKANAKSSLKKPISVPKVNDAPPIKKRKYEESSEVLAVKSAQKDGKEDKTSTSRPRGSSHSALPADFFDNAHTEGIKGDSEQSEIRTKKDSTSDEKESTAPSTTMSISEKLPEGFFDDAKMDAKVRKVEYVDKKEEEWEEFQKMIAEETKVSENLQAEEEDEIKVERDLAEYGALKQYLTRVDKLKQKRESQKNVATIQKGSRETVDDQIEEASGDELEDILNWRAKKA